MSGRQCDCAERTGELVVFTCPLCVGLVLKAVKALTNEGVLVKLDVPGSVSATERERGNPIFDGEY